MLERECKLYAFVLNYCRLLTQDLDDGKLALQPAPGMNHPAWILGHLAIATDYAAKALGESMACPESWHKLFGPGSKPTTDRGAYPSKAKLLGAVESGHERVTRAAARATAEQLDRPRTGILREAFPTVGDMLLHLMTTHPCAHLGQLSAWRRLHGYPAVLGI